MGFFVEFPLLTFFVLGLTLYLLVIILTPKKRLNATHGARICHGCGAEHPPQARYCRRCGKPL